MAVLVTSEERLTRDQHGVIWGASPYKFWCRYLEVFDKVRIVARLADGARTFGQSRVEGPRVSVTPLPHYVGPSQYLRRLFAIRRAATRSFSIGDAVIFRLGSTFAGALHGCLQREGAPYGVEVVGDPWDVFSPGVVRHPLRPFFRWWFTRELKRQCAGACGAAYVTERTLQARYPCGAFAIGVSDVDINSDAIKQAVLATHYSSVALSAVDFIPSISLPINKEEYDLITVGSLSQLYKGTDVLIRAAARCRSKGLNCRLKIIGDGKFKDELERLAASEGICQHVTFLGMVQGAAAVKEHLDLADLFVLPSRTEGLPRALIEAMARGLPCIATSVGGIPELLGQEDMVPPDNVEELATKILEVAIDPGRRAKMSRRNLDKAGEYREDILRERRVAFYRHVRTVTEASILSQRRRWRIAR